MGEHTFYCRLIESNGGTSAEMRMFLSLLWPHLKHIILNRLTGNGLFESMIGGFLIFSQSLVKLFQLVSYYALKQNGHSRFKGYLVAKLHGNKP